MYSLEDSRLVYALRPDELLNPASNTKIFTGAAALSRLGPDYRFLTEFFVDDDPKHGVVAGNLTVRGKGDPSLLSERLWQIGNQLYHQGLREVRGDLVCDDSFFDAVTEGPGWEQDRSDRAYMAPISALEANWSSVAIYISPGDGAGDKAKVELEPDSKYFKLENKVVTGPPTRKLRKPATSGLMKRDGYHITVSGRVAVDQPTLVLYRRVGDPTLYAGETIKEIFAKRGIKIRGKVRRGVVQPSKSTLYFTAESDSLDILLKQLNKHSSNFVAETLLKTLGALGSGGQGTWPNGAQAVSDFLAHEVGIRPGSYLMKNGSGLNDINRFSAAQVVKVLAYIYPRMTIAPEYLSSLPIAGKDGTIRFRMGGTPAAGRVRAKTGTLEDVTALSGFAESAANRHYAFSILVNDFPDTLHQAIQAEDAFAVALASFGPGGVLVRPEPGEALPSQEDRLARYGALAAARDPANAPYLRLAVQNERVDDLRAVAAEALYRSEPDASEAIEALLEVLPKDATTFEAQRRAGRKADLSAILWDAFVDLASDGDGRGLAGLLALAPYSAALSVETTASAPTPMLQSPVAQSAGPVSADAEEPAADDRRTRAAGLVEVARQTPRELLEAIAQSPASERDPARALLLFGLSAEPDAQASFALAVGDAAKAASGSPLQKFATELQKSLVPAAK